MDLETKKTGKIVLLKPLSKSIDATVCNAFKGRVVDLINQGNNLFLLNLSQVQFIDSSGLGAMIAVLKILTLNNGDFILCELNPHVVNLLNLTRMNSVFKICATENEGLDLLKKTKD